MSRFSHGPALVALTLVVAGLTACGATPVTEVGDAAPTIDANRLNAALASAAHTSATPAWESFRALSPAIAARSTAGAAEVIAAAGAGRSAPSVATAAERARTRLLAATGPMAATSSRPSAIAVLPPDLLGSTFVWDAVALGYVRDSSRHDAPATGVRYALYAVNPLNGRPVSGEEIGYVDLTDEGADLADGVAIRLEVVSAGVTYLDYGFSVTGISGVPRVGVEGFLSNGSDRVEFRIDGEVQADAAAFRYHLDVPAHGLTAEATIQARDGRIRVEERLEAGTDVVSFTAQHDRERVEATVAVNGRPFATVRGPAALPEIRRADGAQLTNAEAMALRSILDLTGWTLGLFGDLLAPCQASETGLPRNAP